MTEFTFKNYEPGYEIEQARIAEESARKWLWPYYHSADNFKQMYTRSNFDPETVIYCFKENEMVGYIHSDIGSCEGIIGPELREETGVGASFDIPRVKQGFEEVAPLLLEELIITMKQKGIISLVARTSTMREGSMELLENFGFKEHPDFPIGYKYYYVYNLAKGRINQETKHVRDFNISTDLEICSKKISSFFFMPPSEARKFVTGFNNNEHLVSHLVITTEGELEGYCYALPNYIKEKTIATFYLDATRKEFLEELLTKTIELSIAKNGDILLIDVIGDLLQFEDTFVDLGFDKEATWGYFIKRLE